MFGVRRRMAAMFAGVIGSTGVPCRALVPMLQAPGYGVRALARNMEKARSLDL
jgi:uncharacterized protein YbjT (DUF2867 family)